MSVNTINIRQHHRPFNESAANHTADGSHPGSGGSAAVNDYDAAVAAYRQTFPSKAEVIEQTPDPAVREMLLHMQDVGCDSAFDRFDAQQPQCSFGMAGVCCRNCMMGPCKVTAKAPKGVCGADADLIVSRNLLRHIAGGVAGHAGRGRETMLALKLAAEGKINIPIGGEAKVRATAAVFGLESEGKTLAELAGEIADILLEDLSRTIPGKHRTLHAIAAEERIERWGELDILPISAYHETFEAMHRSASATDGDWHNVMKQFERCGLAYAWSGVMGNSIASDCLFGLPQRDTVRVNLGALERGYVNIAVHGHAPLLVSEIVRCGHSEKFAALAKQHGAAGIRFYGICCSGLSAMYRYGGVVPLSNSVGAELVLGTGALDLWVADVQDVFPAIMDVAACVKTTVITTNDATRLPGAEHIGFDHDHSNIGQTQQLAEKILQRAVESFAGRRDVPVFIPQYEITAEIGFSVEYLTKYYGGSLQPLVDALKSGRIKGIVNLVGCNNPRVVFEKGIAEVADILLANDYLILTNGCASFALMKLGFCRLEAAERAGAGLREFLGGGLPPVWHMGECIDNARASALFKAVAMAAKRPLRQMPLAFISPEWSNEKGLGSAFSFRLLGINSYHCVYPPVQGSDNVQEYMLNGCQERFGSRMAVNPDPRELAYELMADLDELGSRFRDK
ncbi:MAG: carbon monoxide dehydrogenase [Actinomycetia bacterium]|nr:carbon monoxide dehydrogenase [Actinomycetes bacterium]